MSYPKSFRAFGKRQGRIYKSEGKPMPDEAFFRRWTPEWIEGFKEAYSG